MTAGKNVQPMSVNGFRAEIYVLPLEEPSEGRTHAVYVDVILRERADGSSVEIPDPIGAPRYGGSHQEALHSYVDPFIAWATAQLPGPRWPDGDADV